MPDFVFVNQDDISRDDYRTRTKIRRHVMKDFRRQQRNEHESRECNTYLTSGRPLKTSLRIPVLPVTSIPLKSTPGNEAPLAKRAPNVPIQPKFQLPLTEQRTEQQQGLCLLPSHLTSAYNRVRMQYTFCDLFYPSDRTSIYDLFGSVRPVSWAQRVTDDAGDALCTLQLAVSKSDRRMLNASIQLQNAAIQRLRIAVGKPSYRQDIDSLRGAVYYLLKWECITATSLSSPTWQYHYRALLHLSQRKHSLMSGVAAEEQPIFMKFTFLYAIVLGLTTRRPVEWISENPDKEPAMIRTVLKVPPLLAALDATLVDGIQGDEAVQRILMQGLTLRSKLRNLVDTSPLSPKNMALYPNHLTSRLYSIESISQFPSFEAAVSQDVRDLYDQVFSFCSYETAIALRTLWTALLVLDQTLLKVYHCRRIVLDAAAETELECLGAEIEDWADKLCRTIPYFVLPSSKVAGLLSIMEPLHFLIEYFKAKGSARQLEWCQSVRDATVLGCKIARIMECP